ncbi:MAG: prolipoprotein diacylglyceryl transferase [Phycisphaeraceae bacterium]
MHSTLAAWLHNLDPYAIGPIRWYGLSYLLGFTIAWLLVRRIARAGVTPLKPVHASDLIVAVAIGIIVGGRLGYVLFYRPDLLWTVYDGLPFWGVLAINEGGMASHGGMIGGVLACWIFARRHDPSIPMLHALDLIAFAAPLGLFFGRIANFINGELIGRPAPEGLPWAVKFPQEMYDWPRERLDRLLEQYQRVLGEEGHVFYRGPYELVDQLIALIQAGDEQAITFVEPLLTPRHPSQLYAALLEGLMVFLVLLWAWRKPQLPGLIAALFAIVYAVGRIANEFFRRPDVHIQDAEFAWLNITRGQWLSGLLLLVGVWGVWYVHRRGSVPMGGWHRGPWTTQKPSEAKPVRNR